ncbi:hypothetical protein ACULNC_22545 [Shigella flexneri]
MEMMPFLDSVGLVLMIINIISFAEANDKSSFIIRNK